ncbi:NAD-dependent epimerase/dehydratase family protein [Jhaorihella thermophila]
MCRRILIRRKGLPWELPLSFSGRKIPPRRETGQPKWGGQCIFHGFWSWGATGRIGAILRRLWLRSGARTGDHVLWQARAARHGNWAVFDPRDPDAVARAARGCDTILCLAGVTPTRAARGAAMADNVRLGLAAVRGGAAAGARVLLASSAAVYGGRPGSVGRNRPPCPAVRLRARQGRNGASRHRAGGPSWAYP